MCLVVLAFTASACRMGEPSSDDRRSEDSSNLAKAAMATLELMSFRQQVMTSTGGTADGTIIQTIDYVAPDRMRSIQGTGKEEIVTIAIGSDVFVTDPQRPGFYFRDSAPPSATIGSVLAPLKSLLKASQVERASGRFLFSLPPMRGFPDARGNAALSDGLVSRIIIEYQDQGKAFSFAYSFTMFNSVPSIEPPPPNRIVSDEPGLPPCGPGGVPPPGEVVCDPGG